MPEILTSRNFLISIFGFSTQFYIKICWFWKGSNPIRNPARSQILISFFRAFYTKNNISTSFWDKKWSDALNESLQCSPYRKNNNLEGKNDLWKFIAKIYTPLFSVVFLLQGNQFMKPKNARYFFSTSCEYTFNFQSLKCFKKILLGREKCKCAVFGKIIDSKNARNPDV